MITLLCLCHSFVSDRNRKRRPAEMTISYAGDDIHSPPKYYVSACPRDGCRVQRGSYSVSHMRKESLLAVGTDRRFSRRRFSHVLPKDRGGSIVNERERERFCAIEKVIKIFHLRSCQPLHSLARRKPSLRVSRLRVPIRSDIITAVPLYYIIYGLLYMP